MSICGLPPEKVKVVYPGYDQGIFNTGPVDLQDKALLARYGIAGPYIFHHGVVQPRKNLQRLIQAYRMVLQRQSSLDLDLFSQDRSGGSMKRSFVPRKRWGEGCIWSVDDQIRKWH